MGERTSEGPPPTPSKPRSHSLKLNIDMKPFQILAIMSTLATGAVLADTVNFDDLKTGAPPPGWTTTRTGKGEAKWEVVADDSAPSKPNVLKQSGRSEEPRLNSSHVRISY